MSEVGNIINHKIKQNEILSRIVAQNYVGADGKAIDLKTQQGKLLSAKLSAALIGQGDNQKVVIPNAKQPHANHIMAGADLSLVEKLDLGDGLTFVRSDVAKKGKVTVAPEPEAKPAPAPAAEAKAPAEPAVVPPAPVVENSCPDTEAPAKVASGVADNPFSFVKAAEKAEASEQSATVASPAPAAVVPAPEPEPVSAPVAVTPPESVAEPVAPKVEEPPKEVSAHPLTYSPTSFKASLAGGDKKPEDVDIPQLGEPGKPEPPVSTTSFLAEQNFAEHDGEVSPGAIPKGGKPDSTRVAIDF